MNVKKSLIFLSISLLISCNQQDSYIAGFEFGQDASIQINIKNCDTITDLSIYSRHALPYYEFKYYTEINGDTSFTITLPSNLYSLASFKIGGDSYSNLYTIPNDTLYIQLNLNDQLGRKEQIKLKGSSAEIINYYWAKFENWKITKGYDYYYDPKSSSSISEFAEKVNLNRDNDLKFLESYCMNHELPEWFVETEKANISYYVAGTKLGALTYHWFFHDPSFVPSDDYYSFLENLNINNPKAVLSDSYFHFLSLYFTINDSTIDYSTIEPGFSIMSKTNFEIIKALKSNRTMFDSKVKDVLLCRKISQLYQEKFLTLSNISITDSIFDQARSLIDDPALMKIVENYREAQLIKYQNQKRLKKGDMAPSFYLPDLYGKYNRLSDYKGKIAYINFWTTYCSPCIAAIPDKNQLVSEFSTQPFELVNICLDNKPEQWRQIIESRNYAGIHLWCKGNWGVTLQDNYFIHKFPHYVLIDKEGKIISNDCEEPKYISNRLNNIFALQ